MLECSKRTNARVNLAKDEEALDESFAGCGDGNQHLEENELDEVEEEGIDGDLIGETLVIRRSMLALPVSKRAG